MSKGKAEFLRSLREAIAQRKKLKAERRFVLDYLKRWGRGVKEDPEEDPDHYDVRWFARFTDLAEKRLGDELSASDQQVGKLFADCGLNISDPADSQLLLAAIAEAIYPQPAGAKQKWDHSYYDELWRDMLSIQDEEEQRRGEDIRLDELGATEIARLLLASKKLRPRYVRMRQGIEGKLDADSLRKRVQDALDPESGHNPNLSLFDFDYIVRGDPENGPPCAAGLPFQPALPRGSAAAEQATLLEKQLVADAQALFEALGIFMTKSSKFACHQAARRIARRSVRERHQKDLNKGR